MQESRGPIELGLLGDSDTLELGLFATDRYVSARLVRLVAIAEAAAEVGIPTRFVIAKELAAWSKELHHRGFHFDVVSSADEVRSTVRWGIDMGQRLNEEMVGAHFACVRQCVRELSRSLCATEPLDRPRRVVLDLGNSKPMTVLRIARAVAAIETPLHLTLLTPAVTPIEDAAEWLLAAGHAVELAYQPRDQGQLLAAADAAICMAHPGVWEYLYLGCPVAVYAGEQVEQEAAQQFVNTGAAVGGRVLDSLSDIELVAEVEAVVADPMVRGTLSRCGRRSIDGLGAARVVAVATRGRSQYAGVRGIARTL